jgi:glycosyltransferase involved in cell wall biosynthesis
MQVSIIMPCRNEEKYIRTALESVYSNDLKTGTYEVLVVDGDSSDRTVEILAELQNQYDNLIVLDNPNRTVPYAMNIGIRAAKGEYVIRIDAHSEYPPNYFSCLIDKHAELGADNVGCSIETRVMDSNPRSEAIVKVVSDPFGVGNSHFRIGIDEVREVDTVPFGCYKREIFERIGYYDERLKKSQDIELNKRLKRNGGKIFLIPDVKLTYYIREKLSLLAKKYYGNGMWNILVAKYTGNIGSLSLRNYIPFLFVLSNILGLIASLFNSRIAIGYFILLGTYLSIILVRSFMINDRRTNPFWIFLSFLVLHFSHGTGAIVGSIRQLFIRPPSKPSS